MSTVVGTRKMSVTDGCVPGDLLHLDNVSPTTAHVELTLCAEGETPLGPFRSMVPAQRTRALSLDDLVDSDALTPDTPYSVVVVSDATMVVHLTQRSGEEASEARARMSSSAPL
ncbi:sensory rhodopsin transducer [Nonomuraea sp. NPDC050786]|uniref:sensory rhodopsin transducer n=1 Tax=Nonomuraea sp. NPDC050786 TaxID=3154840 RepID=UPI0033F5CC94